MKLKMSQAIGQFMQSYAPGMVMVSGHGEQHLQDTLSSHTNSLISSQRLLEDC